MNEITIKCSTEFVSGLYLVCRTPDSKKSINQAILVNESDKLPTFEPSLIITYSKTVFVNASKIGLSAVLISGQDSLNKGDCVYIDKSSNLLTVIYYAKAKENNLFLTARCNNCCIMCSQPPQKDTLDFYEIAKQIIQNVPASDSVFVTGGEPTLVGDRFFHILSLIKQFWSDTYVKVLTNGKNLTSDFVKKLDELELDRSKFSFGIPLHSDILSDHDYIAGVPNSFTSTIHGLYALVNSYYYIELRIIVQKVNIPRLPRMIDFIAKNLPFVGKVVLMQMEPCGYARKRWEEIWVPVCDYQTELVQAIKLARERHIEIQLYNYQLCVLPTEIRQFAQCSISEWKNNYDECCAFCGLQSDCCGFFSSQDNPKYKNKLVPLSRNPYV